MCAPRQFVFSEERVVGRRREKIGSSFERFVLQAVVSPKRPGENQRACDLPQLEFAPLSAGPFVETLLHARSGYIHGDDIRFSGLKT